MSAANTQRVVHSNVKSLDIRLLIIDPLTGFFGDELVELSLNETRNGCLDTFVNLSFNLTRVINQYCERVEQTLLTFIREVL